MWLDPESAKLDPLPCPSPTTTSTTLTFSFIIPTLHTFTLFTPRSLFSDVLRYELNLRTTAFQLKQPHKSLGEKGEEMLATVSCIR